MCGELYFFVLNNAYPFRHPLWRFWNSYTISDSMVPASLSVWKLKGNRDDVVLSGQGGDRKPFLFLPQSSFYEGNGFGIQRRGQWLCAPAVRVRVCSGTGVSMEISPAPPRPWEETVPPFSCRTPFAYFICEPWAFWALGPHVLATNMDSTLNKRY